MSIRRFFGSFSHAAFLNAEPMLPTIFTSVPGPQSLALFESMGKLQDPRAVHFFSDPQRSLGNFIVDADGNVCG